MKKRLLCSALALVLVACLTPALAAVEDKFPAVNSYPGYADVGESHWAYESVKLCYEVGLMNGTDDGFAPEAVLPISQCAVVAARLREALTGEAIPMPSEGQVLWPWYSNYISYLENVAEAAPSLSYVKSILTTPESPATRQDFLYLLNLATAGENFPALNSISSLPDTDDSLVLNFYNVGVLTGMDEYGTFNAAGTLSRAECAAMVSRIVRPELRQSFVPKTKPPAATAAPGTPTAGISDDTVAMTINGTPLSAEDLKGWVGAIAYGMNYNLYMYENSLLDLSDPQTVQDILDEAQAQSAIQIFVAEKTAQLGCTYDELANKLTPTASAEELNAFANEYGLLCAKHILVNDMDTANAVLNGLKAVPTLNQFNALIAVFGTDPGMSSNPDGYLFGEGEMVEEFENATKALAIGSYTTEPVQSQFGYHIIWRLDPAAHPDLIEEYRDYALDRQFTTWLESAQVVVNEQLLSQIDIAECYSDYVDYVTYMNSLMQEE